MRLSTRGFIQKNAAWIVSLTKQWTENSSILYNVSEELVQLQNMQRQLDPNNTLVGTVSTNNFKCLKLTRLLVDNIGLGAPSYSWQWYRLITNDSSHEISALNNALQTMPVRIFYGRVFRERFAVGLVFHAYCAMWMNFLRGEFT